MKRKKEGSVVDHLGARLDELNRNSLYELIGIHIEEVGAGKARSRLRPPPEVCWPFPGQPHGGVLFTLMDTTMAWAVLSLLEPGRNCLTIHLDIQYIAPAKGDYFICAAEVGEQTRSMSFVSAEIKDFEGRRLAVGQAVFRIIKGDFLETTDKPAQ